MKNHFVILRVLLAVFLLSFLLCCKKEALKTAPVVSITTASNITANSASTGGNVSADGGATVTSRGVCWSTGPNPTTSDNKTSGGSGVGSFTSSITGLNPGVNYTLKAYAINSVGTAYSSSTSFTTLALAPTLTTTDASSLTTTTANSGGNVSSNGGSTVTSRGVCWSTTTGPTISSSKTTDGTGAGSFTSQVTGLNAGTMYYLRSHATNSVGTGYGNEISFTTTATLPVLTTIAITSITGATAIGGGNITSAGGTITVRGVCWGTSTSPTVSNSKTSDSNGAGNYTSNLTGLSPGTIYYVRAYATNSAGTSYGNEVSFTSSVIFPVLTTQAISLVTATSANSGGNITSAGGGNITARGVCWSTSTGPTINNSKTSDGTSIGSFVSSLTGLTFATTYYLRAYATNSAGTAYGNEITFTTATLPVVTTNVISAFTSSTATTGGNVINDSGAIITTRGVCWSTTQSPTTANFTNTNSSGVGGFTSNLTGLSPNTTYYVRAFATNSNGTAYGNQVVFTTDPITVSDIDGNIYKVVRIGTQLWMAENLKTTTYNDGSVIPMVSGNSAWINLNTAAYCWYNNDSGNNKNTYGALYNWWVVYSGKVCPTGWSVSSIDDWTTIDAFLNPNSGGKMKETGTAHWIAPNTVATNETGFSALPGGFRGGDWNLGSGGVFGNLGLDAIFWTRDSSGSLPKLYFDLDNTSGTIWRMDASIQKRNYGFSVRCVKY